jgi:hypothetical protein
MTKEFLNNFIDVILKIKVREDRRVEFLEFFDLLKRLNRDNVMIRQREGSD